MTFLLCYALALCKYVLSFLCIYMNVIFVYLHEVMQVVVVSSKHVKKIPSHKTKIIMGESKDEN